MKSLHRQIGGISNDVRHNHEEPGGAHARRTHHLRLRGVARRPNRADRDLGSDLAAGLIATDGFDNFHVQHFDVLDDLSALTGVRLVTA